MKLENISRTSLGTQVVIQLQDTADTDTVVEGHPQWNRWSNVAKRIKAEHNIEGIFQRADLRQLNTKLYEYEKRVQRFYCCLEVQLSFMKEKDDVRTAS